MDCNGSFHSHAVLHQSSKYMNQCLPQFWSYKQEQRSAKNHHFMMERAIRKRCRKQTAADRNILTKWLSIDLWIDPILLKAQVTWLLLFWLWLPFLRYLTLWPSAKPFNLQDLMSSSPYCLPYSSFNVSFENLVLDQSIIPQLIFFFILITCLIDTVLIL